MVFLVGMVAALAVSSCSLEGTETCGPRLPEQTFGSLPPMDRFETVEYNAEAGRLVLRWHAPEYESLCTASMTQLGITAEGEFQRVRARVRIPGADALFFELNPTGLRQWKVLNSQIPLRNTFNNNPGKFALSVDFQLDYRGSPSLEEQYDSLSARFDRIRLTPVAHYQ